MVVGEVRAVTPPRGALRPLVSPLRKGVPLEPGSVRKTACPVVVAGRVLRLRLFGSADVGLEMAQRTTRAIDAWAKVRGAACGEDRGADGDPSRRLPRLDGRGQPV